jgi:hypothetical protein
MTLALTRAWLEIHLRCPIEMSDCYEPLLPAPTAQAFVPMPEVPSLLQPLNRSTTHDSKCGASSEHTQNPKRGIAALIHHEIDPD